jgi:hypothetical protein
MFWLYAKAKAACESAGLAQVPANETLRDKFR